MYQNTNIPSPRQSLYQE